MTERCNYSTITCTYYIFGLYEDLLCVCVFRVWSFFSCPLFNWRISAFLLLYNGRILREPGHLQEAKRSDAKLLILVLRRGKRKRQSIMSAAATPEPDTNAARVSGRPHDKTETAGLPAGPRLENKTFNGSAMILVGVANREMAVYLGIPSLFYLLCFFPYIIFTEP